MTTDHLAALLYALRVETGQLVLAAQADDALRLRAMELDMLADAMRSRLRCFPIDFPPSPLVSRGA